MFNKSFSHSKKVSLHLNANGVDQTNNPNNSWIINSNGWFENEASINQRTAVWNDSFNPQSQKINNASVIATIDNQQSFIDGSLVVQAGTYDDNGRFSANTDIKVDYDVSYIDASHIKITFKNINNAISYTFKTHVKSFENDNGMLIHSVEYQGKKSQSGITWGGTVQE